MNSYEFLSKKVQEIDGSSYYLVQVLCHDEEKDNFTVCRIYVKRSEDIESKLAYYSKHDDITDLISFKVRNDGKVVLTLK